jgi:hypothetical protein
MKAIEPSLIPKCGSGVVGRRLTARKMQVYTPPGYSAEQAGRSDWSGRARLGLMSTWP